MVLVQYLFSDKESNVIIIDNIFGRKKYILVQTMLFSHPKQNIIDHNINLIIEDHQKKGRYQDH